MKHTLLVLFILACGSLSAQSPYKLTVSQEAYQELTNPHYFSAEDSADGGYYIARNIKFPVFSTNAGFNMNFNPPSRGGWISPQGYIAVYEVPSYGATVVFQAFLSNMQHNGKSSVTYQYDGVPGSGILKVQWKDFGMLNEPNSNMNLQLWLDQATETVSYHFGPHKVDSVNNNLGYSGIFIMANDFSEFYKDYRIQGDPANPTVGSATNFNNMTLLNSIPAPNTVYTIAFNSSTGINRPEGNDFSLYPNPASEFLHINSKETVKALRVYDLCGKSVKTNVNLKAQPQINVSELKSGSYIIEIETNKSIERQLFMKE